MRATKTQLDRINRMLREDAVFYREHYAELQQMAQGGLITREIAKQIIDGTFRFRPTFSRQHLKKIHAVWEQLAKFAHGVTFENYLNGDRVQAGIPLPPSWSEPYLESFDREFLVDDGIIARIGPAKACALLGIEVRSREHAFLMESHRPIQRGARWIRAQLGYRNRGRLPSQCRDAFLDVETGLSVEEGLFAFLDTPKSVHGCYYMDLLGSKHSFLHGTVAYLGSRGQKSEFGWRDESRGSDFGTASRLVDPIPAEDAPNIVI